MARELIDQVSRYGLEQPIADVGRMRLIDPSQASDINQGDACLLATPVR